MSKQCTRINILTLQQDSMQYPSGEPGKQEVTWGGASLEKPRFNLWLSEKSAKDSTHRLPKMGLGSRHGRSPPPADWDSLPGDLLAASDYRLHGDLSGCSSSLTTGPLSAARAPIGKHCSFPFYSKSTSRVLIWGLKPVNSGLCLSAKNLHIKHLHT